MIDYSGKEAYLAHALSESDYCVVVEDNNVKFYRRDGFTLGQQGEADVQTLLDNFDPLPGARERAKLRIVKQCEDTFNEAVSSALSMYPLFEQQVWEVQRREAEGYKESLDSGATLLPTPVLSAIAIQRGINLSTLVDKVLMRAEFLHDIATRYAGEKQKLFDLIDASDDVDFMTHLNFEAPP